MDFPETTDINANTKNNNKIVWKNVTVVDDISGPMMMKSIMVRNIFDEPIQVGLRVAETQTAAGSFFKRGSIFVDLPPQLYERWQKGGTAGRAIKAPRNTKTGRIAILSPDATIQNIGSIPMRRLP